ncbi:hypothetical protein BCR34DRAFT_577755 [Clohesyomyces aquaticus]|uniref:Uncharacterized protein n=1 Tax=Clohesyomyces aquaticus TaxID=1231657 RepID=A0A1Y1YJH7_9PLEO|nr:hypothetical protein BCR34DRAFT_577755 [Clohesyomyces aquaticus]
MSTLRFVTILSTLAAALAIPNPIIPRQQNYPDEVVVLANCDNGESGATMETKDRMVYYQDDYDRRSGAPSQASTSDIHDPATHDGFIYHVGWTAGTEADPVSAALDDRKFKVWGLGSEAEDDAPVSGTATFDGAQFKCYSGSMQQKTWNTDDGFQCTVAYTCTRADRWIRHTSVELDTHLAQVGSKEADCSHHTSAPLNAKDVFQKFQDLATHSWDASNGIDIGGGCEMVFPKLEIPSTSGFHGYDSSTTPAKIAQLFADTVGAKVEEGRTTAERNCPLPGYNGQPNYYHVNQEGLEYPHGGKFEIGTAQQSDPESLQSQVSVEFRIECSCEDDTGLTGKYKGVIEAGLAKVVPEFGIVRQTVKLFEGTC